MAKYGKSIFDESIVVDKEDIDFTFDKFVTEIVDTEDKKKSRADEAGTVKDTDVRKRNQRFLDRPTNRTRYRRRK